MLGICTDPSFMDALDGNGVEVIPAFASAPFDDDEIGFLQCTKVLHHGCAIEFWQELGEGTCCFGAGLECIQNLPAGLICQCLEDQVVINRI